MIYQVEEIENVLVALAVLPAEALTGYLELRAALELAPWSSDQYGPDNARGTNMRTRTFGAGHGLATYVIIEHPEIDERRVVIVMVNWL